jgi:dipeptidyl aminopeptidase/acylaminoacyl peptidase
VKALSQHSHTHVLEAWKMTGCYWALLASVLVIAWDTALAQAYRPQNTSGGEIIDRRPCDRAFSYERALQEWPLAESSASERPNRTEYERAFDSLSCTRILYLSDGLRIVGFLNHPRRMTAGRRYPVIINLRGGTADFGELPPQPTYSTAQIVAEGFVVLSTQYRGAGGSEGQDEHGGADVDDVLNLFPLVGRLPYADTTNVFLLGSSRGGMMALRAVRAGMLVRAVAIKYTPTDYEDWVAARRDMDTLFRRIVPGYERDRAAALARRSAVVWAEELKVPILILHGTADERVPAGEALRLAQRLQALGREYELVMYAGDKHGLPANARDVQERVLRWFRVHMR